MNYLGEFAFEFFIGCYMAILEVLLSVFFSTWWVAIILFLITPLFLKFKVYHDLKSYIRGEAFKYKYSSSILMKELRMIISLKTFLVSSLISFFMIFSLPNVYS